MRGMDGMNFVSFVSFARASSRASPTASSGSFRTREIDRARPTRKNSSTLGLFLTSYDSTNVYTLHATQNQRDEPRLTTTRSCIPLYRFNSARARPRLSPLARSPSPPFASTCALPRYVVDAPIVMSSSRVSFVSLFFENVWITVILFTHTTIGLDPTHWIRSRRHLSRLFCFKGFIESFGSSKQNGDD